MIDNLGIDDRRHQAMVQTGSRRLNPPQPPAANHGVPVDGHLGVSAKNVGPQDFLGNMLLSGIDDVSRAGHGGNLIVMPLFDRVAEDDSHGFVTRDLAPGRDSMGQRIGSPW